MKATTPFLSLRQIAVVQRLLIALTLAVIGIGAVSGPARAAGAASVATAPTEEPTLRQGDRGQAVRRLQERLIGLGYWLGQADGSFGPATSQAVMAFQKVNRLEPDTVVGKATWTALASPLRPVARSRKGRVVEVDLRSQVLLRVRDAEVTSILNTSTGRPGMATPTGHFRVFRHVDGWRHAPLGTLYRPKYFNEGIAIHGAREIPSQPASHGCARVSNDAMDWLFDRTPIGTRVWVY